MDRTHHSDASAVTWKLRIQPIEKLSKLHDQPDGGLVMEWVYDYVPVPCGGLPDCPGIPKSPVHFSPDLAAEARVIMKSQGRLWEIEADAEWAGDHWVVRKIHPQDPLRVEHANQDTVHVFAVYGDYEPFRAKLRHAQRYVTATRFLLGEAMPDGMLRSTNIHKDDNGVPRMIIGTLVTMHVPNNEPEGTVSQPRGTKALAPLAELRVAGTTVAHSSYGPVKRIENQTGEDYDDEEIEDNDNVV